MSIRQAVARLRRRPSFERDLREELQAHLDLRVDDLVAQGLTREEATAIARREFGNLRRAQEHSRDAWSWLWIDRLGTDARYVWRQLLRAPGFAATAVLSLAVGLGALAAVFSVMDGILLRPLSVQNPASLYLIQNAPPTDQPAGNWPVNARHFAEWRVNCRSCESIALVNGAGFTLTGNGAAERIPGLQVSHEFLRTLGVQPVLGRDFLPQEEGGGQEGVVLLTHDFWKTKFAQDPSIIGRGLTLNGESYRVVGVLPQAVHLPVGSDWGPGMSNSYRSALIAPLPFRSAAQEPSGQFNYVSLVRLRAGVTPRQVEQELDVLLTEIRRKFQLNGRRPVLVSLTEQVTGRVRSGLWLLFAGAGSVLLIVCFNTGNLLLVRMVGRDREAAIRLALGLTRRGLFRLVVLEAGALVFCGGALGLSLALAGVRLFRAQAPAFLPRTEEVQVDLRIVAFAVAAMALSVLFAGLLPAWRLAHSGSAESLKAGSKGMTEPGRRICLREWLVAAEVAVGTVVLLLGGLRAMSLYQVMTADKGFAIANVVTQDLSLVHPKYKAAERLALLNDLQREISELPGVSAAGFTTQLPLRGGAWTDFLQDAAVPEKSITKALYAEYRFVSWGFFTAMQVPLKEGRYLASSDYGRFVALISERAAHALWPGQSAVGKEVVGTANFRRPFEVIGVVADVSSGAEDDPPATVYQPYWAVASIPAGLSFVARTSGDASTLQIAIRGVVRRRDAEMPLTPARTMRQILEEAVAFRRFNTYVLNAFAAAGLLLASLGVYSVLSFAVARRIPEIGIRSALGAPAASLRRMMLIDGMKPVLGGLSLGLVAAWFASSLVESQLYRIRPHDIQTWISVASAFVVAGLLASWLPARRAARIDPLEALRQE